MKYALPQNRPFDIVGIGRNSWDRIALVKSYPPPDTKVSALMMENQPGGQVGTTLVAASRLGANTRYLGKFGDDAGGRAVRSALVREDIDLSESKVLPGVPNQTAFIIVDHAHHTRNVFSYVDPRLTLVADDFSHEAVTSGKILFLGGRNPAQVLSFARMGKDSGCLIVVDTDSTQEGIQELFSLADVAICPEPFLVDFLGPGSMKNQLAQISQMGPSFVCCTRGPSGASAWVNDEFVNTPKFKVDVVDTTGAGDVFQGAFLVGLLRNLFPSKILELANAAAALKCRTLGGQKGIPTRGELQSFLSSQK